MIRRAPMVILRKFPRNMTDTFTGYDPRWIGATWSGGVNTPVLGADAFAGYDFTTPTWSAVGVPTVIDRDSFSTPDANGAGLKAALLTVSRWYKLTMSGSNASGGNTGFRNAGSNTNPIIETFGSATFRAIDTNGYIRHVTVASVVNIDILTGFQITTPTLFRTLRTSTPYGTTKAAWTITAGLQAGVVANLDSPSSPANFVIAYHNGTNLLMEKCVNGTYTTLVNAAAAYGAGRVVEIRRAAGTNVFQAFYNGSQIGTDQTISDAGIAGNAYHGMMSTGSGNTASSFTFTGA